MIPKNKMLQKLKGALLVGHADITSKKSFTCALLEDRGFAKKVLDIANQKIVDTNNRINHPAPEDPPKQALAGRKRGWLGIAKRAEEAMNHQHEVSQGR